MSTKLKIGWSCKDISTLEPTSIHGQFYLRVSEGILDPITVTALIIDNGKEQIAMLSCDVTSLGCEIVKKIRAKVCALAPEVDAAKLILNATHTHCTGDVNGAGMAHPGRDYPLDPSIKIMPSEDYQELLSDACAAAVAEAWAGRKPGGIAWGYGYAVVSHSRKTWYLDDLSQRPGHGTTSGMAVNGHACMYGNTNDDQFSHYEAGADHFVNLLFTFDEKNTLTGAIINVPCPSQNSETMTKLTADYWHDVRVMLKKQYGDINILPQCAPAGDLSPRILHYKEAQARRYRLKYGQRPEAFREEYSRKDIAERICTAFTEVLSWAQNDIRNSAKIKNSCEQIDLSLRPISEAEFENEQVLYQEMQAQPFATEGTPRERLRADSVLAARRNRSLGFMKRYERYKRGERFHTELHVLAIDDIAFVTSPFELYMDFMHRIQARSPFTQTFNIQLTGNEYEPRSGYLATERGQQGGGYSSSRYCNVVSPQGGQELVEATLTRLKALFEALNP